MRQARTGSSRSHLTPAAAAAATTDPHLLPRQLLDSVLGPWRSAYEQDAWPAIAPRGRPGIYTRAEDDLLWLGMVR